MTRDHPILATVYCDVYFASTQVQTTAVRIHPDSSMILTGSSTEGRGVDESTEFMVDTGPAGVIETQADDSLAPCLFYAMSNHKENYEQPRFLSSNSSNAVLLPRSKFWEQLTTELCQLGVGPQIINSFIDSHYENLQHFPHVAYRFLSCRESARMVRLTVGLAECIFNSLCILVQGVSESEARVEEWTTQEPRSFDWAGIVELQDNFYDTQRNRVLELAMIYRSIPQPSVEQTPIRNTNPDLEMETQIRSVGAEGKVPVVER
ncbi:hypothetical protein CPB86DRAFT_632550 [Serendipita vermifera]|nr:hypothetical protein CPB86DRAFT_632550 [Serendipita vermifera]